MSTPRANLGVFRGAVKPHHEEHEDHEEKRPCQLNPFGWREENER